MEQSPEWEPEPAQALTRNFAAAASDEVSGFALGVSTFVTAE